MTSLVLLREACRALGTLLQNMQVSSVYVTKPMYVENQSDFYNMVVCGFVEQHLTPESLLEHIHKIEASLGRDRSQEVRNGPRSIDIDIELFGRERVHTLDLEIPHPRLFERAFVLVPLCEALEHACGAPCELGSDMLSRLYQARKAVSCDGVQLLSV